MISISNADLSWYDSKEIETFEDNYNEKTVEFKVGDVIAHTVFGSGVVISINGEMLDVAFKAPHGVKSLIKNHKAIKRLKN
jgi:DNA helicase-2/ATP-dependent DNA helicase PcrA